MCTCNLKKIFVCHHMPAVNSLEKLTMYLILSYFVKVDKVLGRELYYISESTEAKAVLWIDEKESAKILIKSIGLL